MAWTRYITVLVYVIASYREQWIKKIEFVKFILAQS